MSSHIIDPEVIRNLYRKHGQNVFAWGPRRRPAMIAYLFQRPENHIREVLGLPLLAAHQVRPWMPVDEEADEE